MQTSGLERDSGMHRKKRKKKTTIEITVKQNFGIEESGGFGKSSPTRHNVFIMVLDSSLGHSPLGIDRILKCIRQKN